MWRISRAMCATRAAPEAVDESACARLAATVVVQSFPIGIDVDEFTP